MKDVIVIGQGFSGMLSAIWAKEQGKTVSLVHQGAGKILQSTGVMDVLPGSTGDIQQMIKEYKLNSWNKSFVKEGIEKFKTLMKRIGYPYQGNVEKPVEIITGSGHIKVTGLYPETIKPIPETGTIVIVGFQEIADFQPTFAAENLKKDRPSVEVHAINITLGKRSFRTMTQLDAARMLEDQEVRKHIIKQLKDKLNIDSVQADLFVFPSVLGVSQWKAVTEDLSLNLGAPLTEAVGMPPNATAVRLHDLLKKELIRQGVRIYTDTKVIGSTIEKQQLKGIKVENNHREQALVAKQYVIATGGVLGGGLEQTATGFKETVLGMEVNTDGQYIKSLHNVLTVGASQGTQVTRYGITGGIFSVLSSYAAITTSQQECHGGNQAC